MKTTLPQQLLPLDLRCHTVRKPHRSRQVAIEQFDKRARQLADIAASGDEDNAECAAADHFREFKPTP